MLPSGSTSVSTKPFASTTARSVLPAPKSATNSPAVLALSKSAPYAAASVPGKRTAFRAPKAAAVPNRAAAATSLCRPAIVITRRGRFHKPETCRPTSSRTKCAAAEKSVMTPRSTGRTKASSCGTRPAKAAAFAPSATTSRVSRSTASTDGSRTTTPSPRTYTTVLAEPKSTAISVAPTPASQSSRECERCCRVAGGVRRALLLRTDLRLFPNNVCSQTA